MYVVKDEPAASAGKTLKVHKIHFLRQKHVRRKLLFQADYLYRS